MERGNYRRKRGEHREKSKNRRCDKGDKNRMERKYKEIYEKTGPFNMHYYRHSSDVFLFSLWDSSFYFLLLSGSVFVTMLFTKADCSCNRYY